MYNRLSPKNFVIFRLIFLSLNIADKHKEQPELLKSIALTDLKNILVLDIETVSGYGDYDHLSDRFKKQWDRKAALLKNEEQLSPQALYYERAAIYAEFGKIICIAAGIFTRLTDGQAGLRVKAFSDHDEKKVLLGFKELVDEKLDKDNLILCAHNGKEFDFPYLCRRYLVNAIEIPAVLQISGKKPWEVQHLDTMEMWKFGDRKSYTSLDLLASLFNIESSKEELDGSRVNSVYYETGELDEIAEYCKQDVVVTANLYLKLNMKPVLEPDRVHII
ncbi:MAG: 3'-5' exonuclease [Cyclobacteriaceae bacterium]|nr:3'-5' exonuclease [Cyclobacteriaceae bacterium]